MALKVGELYAALSLTSDAFKKGLGDAEKHAGSWASNIGGIFKKAGKLIAVGLAAAGAALLALGKESMDNAVEQERATARVKAAYGKSTDAVEKWVAASSKAWGINDDTLEISMAKYGDWAKNVGMSTKEATKGGEEMAKRASEISLATGKSFEEVFDGLFKGQQGMTRGLKEYGITIDKAALQTEAERLGLIKHGQAMDAATQARARGSLIMAQSTQYTKIAGDMTDSLALKERQMGATFDTIMDTIGNVVLNVATAVMPSILAAFQGLSDWVVANMPMIEAIVKGVSAGVSTAISFISQYIVPGLTVALNILITEVIPAVAAAFDWFSKNVLPAVGQAFDFITTNVIPVFAQVFDWIRTNILPPLQSIFQTFTTVILPALGEAFAGVQQWIRDNWPLISKIIGQVAAAVKTAFDFIAEVIRVVSPIIVQVGRVVFPIVGEAAKILLGVISTVFDAIGAVWNAAAKVAGVVVDAIKAAWTPITSFFTTIWNGITGIFKGGANFLIGIVNGMIDAINGIQVHIGRIGIDTPAGFMGVGPFDWNGLNLGKIPYLARGTSYFPGGWAVLGEQGPELARLPRGTQVFNADQSRGMMGGGGQDGSGGITQHIYGMQPGDVERETRRAMRRQALDWSLEGRA